MGRREWGGKIRGTVRRDGRRGGKGRRGKRREEKGGGGVNRKNEKVAERERKVKEAFTKYQRLQSFKFHTS